MSLSVVEAFLLGIVQGATEWLPVSSSGHLRLAQESFGVALPVAFDLLLHLATLTAVLIVYRARIIAMAGAVLRRDFQSTDGRLALALVIGTIPISIVGLLFADRIETAFTSLTVVGTGLLVTSLVLASTHGTHSTRTQSELGWRDALWVGAWQALALLPGVSRSGMTISAGLHRGLDRAVAADFAFLLGVPALIAAAVLKAPDAPDLVALGWMPLVAGSVAAGVTGWATLTALRGWIRRWGLLPFALYCGVAGLTALWIAQAPS